MQRQDARAPTAQAPDELTREVVALATGLVSRMWAHHQARVAEFDLSQPEAKALLNLEPDCCLSMRELSAVLNANPSNVTVAVGRLEARGLVSRQGADDRRVRGVLLTAAGAALRRRLEARLVDDSPAVRGLTSDERLALREVLLRLEERTREPTS
ncbi:MAG TPA: MarR family transcriptional regulator [Terriglobales bacterium]|nr:MarR family transcriptional regulator [Terriglobales bacterium]